MNVGAREQDYIVYDLPPAARSLVRNVGVFADQERCDFISAYLYDANFAITGTLRSAANDRIDMLDIASKVCMCAIVVTLTV